VLTTIEISLEEEKWYFTLLGSCWQDIEKRVLCWLKLIRAKQVFMWEWENISRVMVF